jgi:hypothetical protein
MMMNNSIINHEDSQIAGPNQTEEKVTNGWQELLPYIDPELFNALDDFYINVENISETVIYWMKNTGIKSKWINHLFFAAYSLAQAELKKQDAVIQVNCFLLYAIPALFDDIGLLSPAKALNKISEESQTLAKGYFTAYQQCQRHEIKLLQQNKKENPTLIKYQLPMLYVDKKLKQIKTNTQNQAQKNRKDEIFGILKEWERIKGFIPVRYLWIKKFESKYQDILSKVAKHELTLPQKIEMSGFDGKTGTLNFLVWNSYSWIDNHKENCKKDTIYRNKYKDKYSTDAFIQFLGEIPEEDWFLEAIQCGALQSGDNYGEEAIAFLKKRGIPSKKLTNGSSYLNAQRNISKYIWFAKKTCNGNAQDSKIIFTIEPLLYSATIGVLSFQAIIKIAARVSEMLQLSMDDSCLGGLYLSNIDIPNKTQDNFRYLWLLYPKGRIDREPNEVDDVVNALLSDFLQLYERYYKKPLESVFPRKRFNHIEKFPGKYTFVFQKDGKHSSIMDINTCIAFITLNHGSKKSDGEPIHIASHALRHIAATLRNKDGADLEKLMRLLHHINPKTTSYYAQLPIEIIIQEIAPILEEMSEEIKIDPYSLRNIDEVLQILHDIVRKFGAVREIPGGKCGTFKSCKKMFLCASCSNYIPGYTENDIKEILKLINVLEIVAKIYEKEGNKQKAKQEQDHIIAWKLILKEILLWRDTLKLPTPNEILALYKVETGNVTLLQDNSKNHYGKSGEQ